MVLKGIPVGVNRADYNPAAGPLSKWRAGEAGWKTGLVLFCSWTTG